jgi:hypothetical protein
MEHMKSSPVRWLLVNALALMVFLGATSLGHAAANSPLPTLSPAATEVVRLVRAQTPEAVVLDVVSSSSQPFQLTAKQILQLHDAGIPSKVISAMVDHDLEMEKEANAAKASAAPATNGQLVGSAAAKPASTSGTAPAPAAATTPSAVTSKQPAAPSTLPADPPPPPAKKRKRGPVLIEQRPPPLRLEIVPDAPTAEYTWVPGHWRHRDGAWLWVPGEYRQRPHVGAVWIDGKWAPHGRGWTWVEGRWK